MNLIPKGKKRGNFKLVILDVIFGQLCFPFKLKSKSTLKFELAYNKVEIYNSTLKNTYNFYFKKNTYNFG